MSSLELTSQFNTTLVPQSTKTVSRVSSSSSSTTNSSNENNKSKLTNKSISNIMMPNSFGKCKVCYDMASGIHYGIATCEGCKGFYKRSLEKHSTYFCFYRNNCLINKVSRNRCKSCRFKKCIKEGMSVKGIRKGRIPKALNFTGESPVQLVDNSITNKSATKANDPLKKPMNNTNRILDDSYSNQLALVSAREKFSNEKKPANDLNFDSTNKFCEWLQNQIDAIKKLSFSEMTQSQAIDIVINFEEDYRATRVDFEIQNILKHHKLFEAELIIPTTLIGPESELVIISLLKDKVYQIYKRHILSSKIINQTNEKLQDKNLLNLLNSEDLEPYVIWINFMETISEFTKWLTRLAKELPGFNKINIEDLSTMVFASVFPLFTVQVTPFIHNDENYTIINNNIQFTKRRMIQASQTVITDLLFEFHYRFQSLNLTEQELCLIYPFLLTSCNSNKIKDKDYYHRLKSFYVRALTYQFELNNRDDAFKKTLHRISQIGVLIELNKKRF